MGFSDLLRSARSRDDYWIEDAIIRFTVQLYSLMGSMSQEELAGKIGATQPYIARILKGRNNFTIATMVKLARAVGGRLDILIREGATETDVSEMRMPNFAIANRLRVTAGSTAAHEVESVH